MSWRIGLAGEEGLKRGSSRCPLSSLIGRLCNEGEVRDPDMEKFRRPRIDRHSLFVFGSGQLIKAWILSGGIVFC